MIANAAAMNTGLAINVFKAVAIVEKVEQVNQISYLLRIVKNEKQKLAQR